jgi:hypothetical protein
MAGVYAILDALTSPKSRVVQAYFGGDEWPWSSASVCEDAFLLKFVQILPASSLMAVNLGEREVTAETTKEGYWVNFLDAVKRSLLGHLWLNENRKGGCPKYIRGSKKKANGKCMTGLQKALYQNRTKPGYEYQSKNPDLCKVLLGGLKCWKNFGPSQKTALTEEVEEEEEEEEEVERLPKRKGPPNQGVPKKKPCLRKSA